MKFKKNVFSNLLLHIINILIGFVTSVIIARSLGADNQGQFSFYLLVFGLIASYGGIGIISSTSYFIKKTEFKKEDIINNNISVLIILSLLYTILIIIFRNKIFDDNSLFLLFIWIIYSLILLFNNFLLRIYVADENIYVYNKYFILIYILRGIVIGIMYYIGILNIFTLSLLYALLEILKNLVLLTKLKFNYKFCLKFNIIKKELKYGLPMYFSNLFVYLNYRVDQLFVKEMLGSTQLGIYSIAVHLAELAFIFSDSIKASLEGLLYNCKQEQRKKFSSMIIKLSFYLTLIICFVGILCEPLVGILYGQEYKTAGITMVILLIGIIFISIGKVAPAYFTTQGKTRIPLFVSGLVLLINLIFNYILIPKYKIIGAAIATTIAYFFFGIIYIILLLMDGISIKDLIIIKRKDLQYLKKTILKSDEGNRSERNE